MSAESEMVTPKLEVDCKIEIEEVEVIKMEPEVIKIEKDDREYFTSDQGRSIPIGSKEQFYAVLSKYRYPTVSPKKKIKSRNWKERYPRGHVRNNPPGDLRKSLTLSFLKCDQCDFVAKRPGGLSLHRNKMHIIDYSCPMPGCKHSTHTTFDMMQHCRKKHRRSVFECAKCEFTTTTEAELENHKYQHLEN